MVKASQLQNGYQPLQNGTTSYLQSGTEVQAQVNWLFDWWERIDAWITEESGSVPTIGQRSA